MAFRLLALAVPDPVKMEIKIAYPERDIMECTLVVIVFSVNAGKVIASRTNSKNRFCLMRPPARLRQTLQSAIRECMRGSVNM